jgi:hypothetical protein
MLEAASSRWSCMAPPRPCCQATSRPAALQLQRRRRQLQPACCPAPAAPLPLALLLIDHSAQSHSRATPHALLLPLAAAAALASAPTAWRSLQRRARGSRAPRVRSTCRGSRASGLTRRRPNLRSALPPRPRTAESLRNRLRAALATPGPCRAARSRYIMPNQHHARGVRPSQASQRRPSGAADRMRTLRGSRSRIVTQRRVRSGAHGICRRLYSGCRHRSTPPRQRRPRRPRQ